jgi:HEAT repeat protein
MKKELFVIGACLIVSSALGQVTNKPPSPWKGNIVDRRKAITEAAQSKNISDKTIISIVDAMASTANEVEPDAGGGGLPSWQDPMGDLRKAMGARPVLLGACCDGLLGIGAPAFKDVVNGLGHENRWVRLGCAWVLGRMGNKDAVIALSSRLDDKTEDKNVRGEAASSLKLLNDPRCVPYAERALQSVAMDRGGFYSMTTLIAKYDESIASKWVCELGKPTQPKDLRQVSAEVAGMLKDRATGDLLLILLKDKEGMVRLEAARSAGIRSEKAAESILSGLATSTSENGGVRTQAALALARLGVPAGIQVLEQIATSGPDFAKGQAKDSLDALKAGKIAKTKEAPAAALKFEGAFVDIGGGSYCRIE